MSDVQLITQLGQIQEIRKSGVKKRVIPGLTRNPGGYRRYFGFRIKSRMTHYKHQIIDFKKKISTSDS